MPINRQIDPVNKPTFTESNSKTEQTDKQLKSILKKQNKKTKKVWDSLYGKYEPIKKSKLEKLLSFFFKTPDDERNKLYVALKKAFTPGLWFKKAANPQEQEQEQEKTKLTLKDPVSEGNKEEVTEYYDNMSESVLTDIMTDIMANETKENIDVKAIIEENFNMLTANDFVNLINSLKEPEKTTQQEITLFKSLANEYIAIKVYNNLRSSEQKHMIQKWFQQGDLSFKVFKKEFSAYKNKRFDNLKGTITLVAGLDLQKYLDNDRIKELVSAKYPPATAIKQIWKIEKESIENARKEMKKTLTKNKECKFLKEIKGDSIYKLNPNYGSGAGTMYNIVNLLTNTKISDEAKMSRLFKILDKSSLVITDPEIGTFLDGEAKKVWDNVVKKAYGEE